MTTTSGTLTSGTATSGTTTSRTARRPEQVSGHRRSAAVPERMRAVVQDRYGAEDVLQLREVDVPTIGDDEVLVRVAAAGVDRGVWHLMTGLPYAVRLAGYGLRAPKTAVRGLDLAGTVVATGRSVSTFEPGDDVFGIGTGSFAEFSAASAAKLAPKPPELTFEQAAAVPVSGLTALQAVRDRGRVRPAQHVMVIGASGGVGSFAVQIAKAFGAEVTGVCSTAKVDLVRAAGADHVLDYTVQEVTDAERPCDVIIDVGGNRPLSLLRRCLTPTGTLVIVGGETDGRWLGGADRQVRAQLLSPFVGQRLGTFISSENGVDLAVLGELLRDGLVAPMLDRTYPLDQAPAAVRHVHEGRARGKVVLTP